MCIGFRAQFTSPLLKWDQAQHMHNEVKSHLILSAVLASQTAKRIVSTNSFSWSGLKW